MKKFNYFKAMFVAAAMISATVFVSCGKDDPDPSPNQPNQPNEVAVTGITINKSTLSLAEGSKETLSATVTPANATVAWSSSNTSVASVGSSSGEVTAVAAGAATITATAGGKTATCAVTVNSGSAVAVPVTGLTLSKTAIELEVDAREPLTATVTPANASIKTVAWSSANEGVATVSQTGEVAGKAAGTTTITAKAGNVTATCAVTVKERSAPLPEITVTITGTINHTTHTKGQKGTVEFNRFPATLDEFKAVREKIGTEPHGAVALELMAYEMFRRNQSLGTECINLVNTSTNLTTPIARLKELFGTDANYNRPYQVASFLKGATPANGYNPTKPYTVEVKVNDALPYQPSSIYQSTVLYLDVLTTGTSTGSRAVEVLTTAKPGEPGENKFFIVMNDPGLYAQCAEISFTNPWKGLD